MPKFRTLSECGPDEFIEQVGKVAGVPPCDYFKPLHARFLVPHRAMSFHDFIRCVVKYTSRQKCPIDLDAIVVPDTINIGPYHRVFFTGIRDTDLRNLKAPRFLPGRQEACWHLVLEDVLEDGVLPEDIDNFRYSFNLLSKYGYGDSNFFERVLYIGS